MEVEQEEETLENEQEKENVDISRLSIEDQETNQVNIDSNTSTEHAKHNKKKHKNDKNRDRSKDDTVADGAEERNIEDVTNKQRQSRSSSIRETADNSVNKSKSADRSKSADNSDKSSDKKRKGSTSSSIRMSSKRSKSSVGSLHPIPEGEVSKTRTASAGEVRVNGTNGVNHPPNDDEVFR